MKLKDYQIQAQVTAIYPAQYKIAYPMLGLCGEYGEAVTCTNKDGLEKELGDLMWYIAGVATDLGIELREEEVPNYGCLAWWTMAEVCKKILRDGMTEEKKTKMRELLHAGVRHVKQWAESNGLVFENVLINNLAKLRSRQERGKLQGSGDNR